SSRQAKVFTASRRLADFLCGLLHDLPGLQLNVIALGAGKGPCLCADRIVGAWRFISTIGPELTPQSGQLMAGVDTMSSGKFDQNAKRLDVAALSTVETKAFSGLMWPQLKAV